MKKNGIPGHLSKQSKKLWRGLVAEYGIQDSGGLAILKAGLEALDRCIAAREQIDSEGLTIIDRFGTQKPHPLIQCERDARGQWLAALKQLNMDIEPLRDVRGRPPGK